MTKLNNKLSFRFDKSLYDLSIITFNIYNFLYI